ncbi:CDP-diacylglycerol--glycerol-3-phosphate 3-phosphatidyltransferase [Oligoflexaceae bacterium]|nr:CDP-diacylglycerol--glycerol-3-phosphate 3-phosphatidyltransferase [Oligoflexaceae bacterium]
MDEKPNVLDKYLKRFSRTFLQSLPNKLTIARIAAIPLLMLLYPLDYYFLDVACAILFAAAAITDFLDGYLARKYDGVSEFGVLIDPIADKMLVAAALILLSSRGILPSWMAILLVSREFAVNGIRLVSTSLGFSIPVDTLGKYKVVFQDIGIVCLFLDAKLFDLSLFVLGMILLWAALALSLYSAYFYWQSYQSQVRAKRLDEISENSDPTIDPEITG